ncbi:hypothetical protein HPB47_006488, partial [Ixodes persulcatus]
LTSRSCPICPVLASCSFREIVREVVREELRKILPTADRPTSLSLAEVVREEVHRAFQPEVPINTTTPEEPTLSYAAMARQPPQANRQATAPPRRDLPMPQYPRRQEGQVQDVRPERASPRKTDVWRTADRRPLCYHCGEADHIYRGCPYRRLGLRGFHPNDPRPRQVGHVRGQCRAPWCSVCRKFGHDPEDCIQTYANRTAASLQIPTEYLMDAEETALTEISAELRHQPERRQTQDLLQGALSASDQDVLKTWRQTLCYGVCLAIVVALLAALLAFFILYSQSGIRPRALCVSTECKRFALEITGSLNTSESPCRDFYGYVCGHWSKSHPDHVSEVHRRRSEFMDEEAEHLLNCSVPKSNRSAFEKAASLFRECVNGSDVDLETFRTSLDGLFGIRWPHPADIVDPLMLVVDLSMQWQLPILLRLRNNALVQSGDVSSIVFEGVPMYWWRARVERMHREGSYEGYVREYIRAFKRTPDDDKEFVANVSRRLQTVERHFLDHRDDFFEREGLLEKLTVGELEAKYTSEISTVQWVDAISWVWTHTVNESDTVYLAHPAALELFNSLLLNFSSEDVELFIGWLVIQTLAPSVSLKLRDLLFVNTTVEQ